MPEAFVRICGWRWQGFGKSWVLGTTHGGRTSWERYFQLSTTVCPAVPLTRGGKSGQGILPRITPFLWAQDSFWNTLRPFFSLQPCPGWGETWMDQVCGVELRRCRRTHPAPDRCPWAGISHSEDQISTETSPSSSERSSEEHCHQRQGSGRNRQLCFPSAHTWLKYSVRDAVTHAPSIWDRLTP